MPIPKAPTLVFFQEIKEGDVKKQLAKSNDADTGGGARDLRLRGSTEWMARLDPMFPNNAQLARVKTGRIYWQNANGTSDGANIELWPPTDARPDEARIARISEILGWEVDEQLYRQDLLRGQKQFYILVCDADGVTWARILFESNLSNEDPAISAYVRQRIQLTAKNRSVRGSINLVNQSTFP